MIRFVLRKMFHKKWLMAALLIGNILLISIAAGNPMYTEAALQRMLTNTMSDYVTENGRYPTMAYMVSNITQNTSLQSNSIELFNEADARAAEMPERLGLDSKWLVRNIFLNEVDISPVLHRSNMSSVEVRLGFLTGIEEHSKIINGRMYNTAIEDGIIEVIVSEKALIELNLLLDEVLVIDNMTDAEGNPLFVKVVDVLRDVCSLYSYSTSLKVSSYCDRTTTSLLSIPNSFIIQLQFCTIVLTVVCSPTYQ